MNSIVIFLTFFLCFCTPFPDIRAAFPERIGFRPKC